MAWCVRRGRSPAAAIAYAWNPLALVEYAGSGHHDPTGMVWLAVALIFAESRPRVSALALSVAAQVKLLPLAALPFLMRRWTWSARFLCLGLLGIGLGWFWIETRGSHSGLTAYWQTWRNNELIFHYLERWAGDFGVARGWALAAVAAVAAAALALGWDTLRATRVVLRAGTLAGPVMHPWYLGWTLMLEPLAPSAAWLLLSCTAILNYGVLAPPPAGAAYHLPLAWRWAEYGAPLALAAAMWLARRGRSAADSREEGARV
jgi:hypothetical protein